MNLHEHKIRDKMLTGDIRDTDVSWESWLPGIVVLKKQCLVRLTRKMKY